MTTKPARGPLYMIMCGGSHRSELNPFGTRWHPNPDAWFDDELAYLTDHDQDVIFHQPGGFLLGTTTIQPQQGSRLDTTETLPAKFFSSTIHLAMQGIRVGVYWSCERVTNNGTVLQPVTPAIEHWEFFRNEWNFCKAYGIESIWRDRGAHFSNYPLMIHVANVAASSHGITEGVEAFPHDRITGASRLLPGIPALCLDQFITPRWEIAKHWVVPEGHEAHVLAHNPPDSPKALTPEQKAVLLSNGWTLGQTSAHRKATSVLYG